GAFADGIRDVGRALSGISAEIQDGFVHDGRTSVTGKRRMGLHRAEARMGPLQVRPYASERVELGPDDDRAGGVFVSEEDEGLAAQRRGRCGFPELAAIV